MSLEHPHPSLGPGALRTALRQTMEEERTAATAATTSLRRGVSFTFLIAVVLLWTVTGDEGWRVYLAPLALHSAFAGLSYLLRSRPWAPMLALPAAMLDCVLVTTVQYLTLAYSTIPAGVAGFTLGVMAMVIVLNALTLRPSVVLVATISGIAGQIFVMATVGVNRGPMVIAALVLTVVAVAGSELMRRMRGIMSRFAAAEIARQIETRHSAEVEEARRTIEGMLADSRAQTERLERLQRDKDSLTQLLVHDLRSPITVIVGYVDLVKIYLEQSDAPSSYTRALDQALGTASRLTAMISDLLQIAKLEDGRLTLVRSAIDPRPLLDEMADAAKGLVQGRNVHIGTSLDGAGTVEADANMLRRVLENLVSNAARFTPTGARLHVGISLFETEAVLVVENDGPAIEPASRERLFDKYQQGANARSGWGLGLYFCRLAVEAHGGSIRVEERGDFPTSFVIRLPRAVPPVALVPEKAA